MNYWKLLEKDNLCTYLITNKESILIVNVGKEENIVESITNKKFKNIEIYNFKLIKEIIFIDNEHTISIIHKEDDEIDKNINLEQVIYFEIKAKLINNMRGVEIKKYSIYKQIVPNIVTSLIVGILTFTTYSIAIALKNGEHFSVSGRKIFVKKIIVQIAELLGPIWVLVIGIGILIILVYFIIKKIKNPKVGNVIKFKNFPELIITE